MKVIIVGHPSRAAHIGKLVTHLPVVATVVDTISAWSGHNTALRLASQCDERVAIMEDDAIPVEQWDALSDWWDMQRPHDLISFYLGTSRPREFQSLIDMRIRQAELIGEKDIYLSRLIHGVCYSVPRAHVHVVVERMNRERREADFAIGNAWGRSVCYPIESLVQHRDEAPVEKHPDGEPRKELRVARRLAGSLMFEP